jgi:hypothetical protein
MKSVKLRSIILLFSFVFFTGSVLSADPAFSLHNKSKKTISLEIMNGNTRLSSNVQPGKFSNHDLDIRNKTTLIIRSYDNPNNTLYEATFSLNKTIYLNWDENNNLPYILSEDLC